MFGRVGFSEKSNSVLHRDLIVGAVCRFWVYRDFQACGLAFVCDILRWEVTVIGAL